MPLGPIAIGGGLMSMGLIARWWVSAFGSYS